MMTSAQIAEILALYRRHGWTLRRVLLSEALRVALADSSEGLFGPAEIVPSDIDAAWFSRSAVAGRETWEIRRLGPEPYALCEVFDDEDEEEIREETRQELEAAIRGR
jgi:hypothetical protein